MEEGSLGATVDLHTGHPFDHPGFVFTTSGAIRLSGLSQKAAIRVSPRLSPIRSTMAISVCCFLAPTASVNTLEEGTSSVKWQNNLGNASTTVSSTGLDFGSVSGTTCKTSAEPAICATVGLDFRSRFPRYEIFTVHEKRLGLTGSVQWQPDDNTLFTVDALFADFNQVRNEYQLEAQSFSATGTSTDVEKYVDTNTNHGTYVAEPGVGAMNLLNYTVGDPGYPVNGTSYSSLTSVEASNVGMQSEHRLDHLDTKFEQVTIDGTHSFSEVFKVHVLAGWSESHHRNPIQTTLVLNNGCVATSATSAIPAACSGGGAGTTASPYIYDYTVGNIPYLNTGSFDPTSSAPGNWFLANIRERQEFNYNSFRTANADFEYSPFQALKFEGGLDYRDYGYGTSENRRQTSVGATELSTIPAAQLSAPVASYTNEVSLRRIAVPGSSLSTLPPTTTWLTPNFALANSVLSIWNPTIFPLNLYTKTAGGVREDDYAGWLQADWDTVIPFFGDMPFRGNIGGRFILTELGIHSAGLHWAVPPTIIWYKGIMSITTSCPH